MNNRRRSPFGGRRRGNIGRGRGTFDNTSDGSLTMGFRRGRGAFESNSEREGSLPLANSQSLNYFRPSKKDLAECTNILQLIISNNDCIDSLLTNGDLLNLLNGSSQLPRDQVYNLLSSVNLFTASENSPKSIKGVFILIFNSNFISSCLNPIITDFFRVVPTSNQIKILITFMINCLQLLPKQFLEKMGLLYPGIIFTCQQFSERDINDLYQSLTGCFDAAKKRDEEVKTLSQELSSVNISSSDNFRTMSVIPQSSDIFCLNEEVPLRVNKFAGENGDQDSKYESVDDYLDTQFCLLKEDFVRPLRDGIAQIREDLLVKSKLDTRKLQIRLYENVIVGEMYTSRNGLVHKVKFDITKFGRIDWKKAKRFIYGSLLCFTNNFFETIYFATVVDSDPKSLEKGLVVVQFNDDPISDILDNNEFMMIETKNLFEAYRHVLTKLHTFTEETLPFKEYLVFANNTTSRPVFMKRNDLHLITNVARNDGEFDDSQRVAFENALHSSLSLIQGPPGTGKTYVGLKIIKYLVNNFQNNVRNIGPILVVCYTNHALDQFLCDIIEAIGHDYVIRVGGRSKMEIMKECNISNIRHKWIRKRAFAPGLYRSGIEIRRAIELAEECLIRKYVRVNNYDKRLLSFNEIQSCLNHSELFYFHRISFDSWIKGGDLKADSNLKKLSVNRQKIVNEQCNRCIDDVVNMSVRDIVRVLFRDAAMPLDDNEDLLVEDPDDVLYDQRFLDGDDNIMKNGNLFQSFYDDENIEVVDNGVDDEGFKSVANVKLIKNKLKYVKPLTDLEYQDIKSLDVDFDIRLRLYKYWLEKYRIILIEEYRVEKEKFDFLSKQRKIISDEEYVAIMRSMKVIGMTTTGAARYGSVLDKVGCRVVVIEEAAEVMEAHVVCSMSEHCEQLIMIGDHKQLRPKIDVYDLEINYNLGISLFERLIANKCPFFTLEYQHRMRPEISVCVKPIYPNLKDSDVVFNYPSVVGMKKDVYFFNHNEPESSTNETSYRNDFEADFVAKLCEYLIASGNLPGNITVLTLYSGQLYNINNRMRQEKFRGIRICVIDNFQGEENEIIILSLVRSNMASIVGFVTSENRLCVTLSRAKRGFYVVGNFNMICRKSPLLYNIITMHLHKDSFGSKLPLHCLMHPIETNYCIKGIEDFQKKGCPSKCGITLKCGHVCTWPCHRVEPSHQQYKCTMPCTRLCTRDMHKCRLLCHQRCSCVEEINVKLPCGHDKEIMCRDTQHKCTEICEKTLDCRHRCTRMCHEKCKCEVKTKHVLNKCGHTVLVMCDVELDKIKCQQLCAKILGCGHQCREKCWTGCVCKQLLEFELPCSHKKMLRCGTDVTNENCTVIVEREFECGHVCKDQCHKIIDKCVVKVRKELQCGHVVDLLCGDSNSTTVVCEYICNVKLPCQHKCQGKCGSCYQGSLHIQCSKKCKKFLMCTHYCEEVCHPGFCPPCTKPCIKFCEHSQCALPCGQPCDYTVCDIQCTKIVLCTICKKKQVCTNRCGESCSVICKSCLFTQKKDSSLYYCMEACRCFILKTNFKPICKIDNKAMSLQCQDCKKYLRTPYSGVVLIHFKKEYANLFQPITDAEILKWNTLFNDLKTSNCVAENFENIMETIATCRICKEDLGILDMSYKYYLKLLKICQLVATIDGESNLEIYQRSIRNEMLHIMKWLNPFIRNFTPIELAWLITRILKLSLSADVLSFLDSVTVTEYALIHKQLFGILNEIEKTIDNEVMTELRQKFEEIQSKLNRAKPSSKEEEALVERIMSAKDIYREFGIERYSNEDKIKELKNLIRRCHPDKNRCTNAKAAVQRLLERKKLLE